MTRVHYDTDLTDLQWTLLENLLPPLAKTGRKPIDIEVENVNDQQTVVRLGEIQ